MDKDLLKKDTAEIVTEEEFDEITEKTSPKSYWGVAPTGAPHIGYYRLIEKQQQLMDQGFDHSILIADLHGYLDDEKTPWDVMGERSETYKKTFELLGLDDAEFFRGSEFQTQEEYMIDTLRSMTKVTASRAERAGSEVVRAESPSVGELAYPIMQNLDAVYLESDLAVGGTDQRHVYMLGREMLPEMGYESPAFMFTPLGKSIRGDKMSASEGAGKLTVWEDPESIDDKIQSAYCPPEEIEENPVVDYISHFVLPQLGEFKISRKNEYGGDLEYTNRENFEQDYRSGEIHPADLKPAASKHIAEALEPVREYFSSRQDLKNSF